MKPGLSLKASRLALAVAIIMALALPLSYFILGYQRLSVILQTEVEANALFASQIINNNPDYWPYEQNRLREFLTRTLIPNAWEIRRIIDLKGETVARVPDEVIFPAIIRSCNLYDSGKKVVAKLEISRSLRRLLAKTGLVGFLGCLLMSGIYVPLKKYVLDAHEEARKALWESEKRFKDIAENSLEWIWEVDVQGKYIYASPGVEKLLGYRPEEILNQHFYDLFHPDDREELKEQALALFAAKQPFREFPNRNLHKDGRVVWLSTSGLPVLDDRGEIIGYRGADTDITARRRAEEALAEEAIRRRVLVEQSRDGIVVLDQTGKVYEANQRYAEMLGYSAEEVRDLYVWDWDAQWTREELLEQLRRVDVAGDHFETRHRRRDGTIFDVEISSNGAVLGGQKLVFCVCRDISPRKAAERALRESEENYRLLVKQIPAVVFRGYADWSIDCFDNKIEILTGYPKEDFDSRRRKWRDLILEEDFPGVKDRFLHGLKNGGTYTREYRIRKKSGEIIWVQVQGQIFRDAAGKIDHISGMIFDITERKQAEKALIASEANYRTIFNAANDAIFVQDARTGEILDANQKVLEYTGYSYEEIRNLYVGAISMGEPPYTQKEALEWLHKAATGEVRIFDWRGKDKSGRVSWFEVSLKRATLGKKECVLAVARDIAGRKQAEEERRQLESQLLHVQKMEAIGTLAGGIAHDFNNILSALLGYTELALDDLPEGTETRDNLEQVLRAGERAKDLVKQILTFSRQDKSERQPVQLGLYIKEAVKFLRASLPTTIEIRQNLAAGSGKILADPTQIHQVLINLCTNAAQAMEESGGILEINLEKLDLQAGDQDLVPDLAPGPYLRLTVSDTGKGMAPEVLDRIYEPFFTTKGLGEGTGLGLAVVHGIVKSQGGDIKAFSESGKGTTIQVLFPKIESQEIAEAAALTEAPKGHGLVLLVDDEQDLVHLWEQMLKRLGYRVVAKACSIEALETFQAQPDRFDLVITDQTMPRMTGTSLAKELLLIRPDIPIVLCTGFTDKVKPEQVQALGIRELITKPLSMNELAMIIKKVLEGEPEPVPGPGWGKRF